MLKQQKYEETNDSNNIASETNCESNEKIPLDSFSLEFAATQWQKLVSNAEGLFMNIVKQNIPNEAREQVEQWLFLKQECEGCISSSDGLNNKEKEAFSLDRIDEVTESESKSSSDQMDSECEFSDSGAEIDDITDLSQIESKRQDFADNLEVIMLKFCERTDLKVNECFGPTQIVVPKQRPIPSSSNFNPILNRRRKSILPLSVKDCERISLSNDGAKKESDIQSSLSQSKKKLKKFLKQLRKDDEQTQSDVKEKQKMNEKIQLGRNFIDENRENLTTDSEKQKKTWALVHNQDRRIISNIEDKILRDEITNLRTTRDFLVEQRKGLDKKLNRDRSYSHTEERRFIEVDEAIEAIDATIEFKNGSICGRSSFEESAMEAGEQMLLDRLMKLSETEMRSLLFKYFQKTVDLRESGRKFEQQVAELDHQIEAQAWKIQTLSSALQQANAENERRLVMVHRQHEEKLHLMFRHYTGTGTSSSADTKTDESPAFLPLSQQASGIRRRLQATSTPQTTKVTRQKNKLIIQKQTKKTNG